MSLLCNGAEVGTFHPDGVYTPSDRSKKRNVTPLDEVLSGLMLLAPSSYDNIHTP